LEYSPVTNSLLLKSNAQRFTQLERSQFTLTNYLKEALIGLFLGDLYVRSSSINYVGATAPKLGAIAFIQSYSC
jgi:hypothetical protein